MPGHIYCRQRNSGEAEVIGGDRLFGCFPPAEQPLPEVVLRRGVLLRRANVRRRRMLGGRANSGEAALVGGDNFFGRCSPAEQPLTVGRRQLRRAECSSELALRRGGQLRGANVRRRRMLGGRANSGEAALVGGDRLFGCCSPTEQPLTVGRRQLRRAGCSSEVVLRRGVQLRGANVRRRRMLGGRANSGEAALVGGDRLFGCFPPAEQPLTGGGRQPR